MKKAGRDFCLSQKQALEIAKDRCVPITSHELAAKLLELPNLLISSHEHGEICTGVKVARIAGEIGLLKGIVLEYGQ